MIATSAAASARAVPQTMTTFGYGDVTPKHAEGRLIAAIVMLAGIAFIAVITPSAPDQ